MPYKLTHVALSIVIENTCEMIENRATFVSFKWLNRHGYNTKNSKLITTLIHMMTYKTNINLKLDINNGKTISQNLLYNAQIRAPLIPYHTVTINYTLSKALV